MIINRILFSIFLYFFILTNSYAASGAGKIKLSNRVIMGYIQYLQMNSTGVDVKNYPAELKKGIPNFFAISQDGNYYGYSYCPRGQSCVFNPTLALQLCKKRSDVQKCYIFDRKRKIVWGNKNYKISRKATSSEIREILDELGFTGTKKSTTISSNTDSNSKITKNNEIENNDIVKQIQELNEMFKSGVISKEEFDKAKKKILN